MVRPTVASLKESHTARVLGCALAIFLLYFAFGILQEKITRSKYGAKGEKFHFTFILVLIQCIGNTILAQIVIMISSRWASTNLAPAAVQSRTVNGAVRQNAEKSNSSNLPIMHLYFACAMSYMFAMLASNYALQFVNYPTQVLAKSCKPIPVMLLGVLLAHKRYPPLKYLFVLLITAGVAMFMYNPRKAARHATAVGSDTAVKFGEFLLFFSLMLDGLTGVFQERLRRLNIKSHHLMLWINIFSTIMLTILVVVSGEIFEFIPFVQRHPHVLLEMLGFALCSALGQYFIFMAVIDFGPLMLSIMTTTRKFFSVLFSVVFFGNEMLPHQWLATGLVFAGLLADSIYSKRSTPAAVPEKKSDAAVSDTEPLLKTSDDEDVHDENTGVRRRRIVGNATEVDRRGGGDSVFAETTADLPRKQRDEM